MFLPKKKTGYFYITNRRKPITLIHIMSHTFQISLKKLTKYRQVKTMT